MTHLDAAVVVVGASQAAVQLASSLRDLGHRGPITLVGAEAHPPYQRPPLSKSFLKGEVDGSDLLFRSSEFYNERDITLILGDAVDSVEPDGESGVARLASGRIVPYDRLVLATGAAPRCLTVPGSDSDGVHYLRDLDDARAMIHDLGTSESIVVVGGGFIGLEAAATARALGKDVAVVEAGSALMARAVGSSTSHHFLEAHRAMGVEVLLDATLAQIECDVSGRVSGVVLADGSRLPAQTVVVGIGVIPRVELAEQLGLDCSGGVVVDEYSLASDGTTIAIGDCANLPDPSPNAVPGSRLRLESVDNAVEQAKVAARTLCGVPIVYRSLPWFWSDQGASKLQIAGLSAGHDHAVVRAVPEQDRFATVYFRDGQMIAMDAVNWPADFMAVKRHLASGLSLGPDGIADSSRSMKSIISSTPTA